LESDLKIWDDFRKGEKYALPHIYYKHIELLYRYGRKFSQDGSLIKDTIQDLFHDLILTREKLGATDNILFYLMCSLQRRLIRSIKMDQTSSKSENHEVFPNIVYSAEEEMIESERLSQRDQFVRKCLQELNPRQREILYYRYTCNLEYKEICELMSLKYDSARKLVFRALASMKKLIDEGGIFHLLILTFRGNHSANQSGRNFSGSE
jgi:RNA polymerase sigma factor (sigma-70 family)